MGRQKACHRRPVRMKGRKRATGGLSAWEDRKRVTGGLPRMEYKNCRGREISPSRGSNFVRNSPAPVSSLCALTVQLVQHIPHTEHVHDAQSPVVETVAGADTARLLVPQMTAVIRADIALVAAVVVSL